MKPFRVIEPPDKNLMRKIASVAKRLRERQEAHRKNPIANWLGKPANFTKPSNVSKIRKEA